MTSPDTSAGIQDAARHLAEGRPTEAVEALERLVHAFPSYVTAYVLLAKASEAAGDIDRALEAWHAAHFLMPSSPLVTRERQRLLRLDVAPPELLEDTPESDASAGDGQPSSAAPDASTSSESSNEASDIPETVVGGEPDAWVADLDAADAPNPPPQPLDPGDEWQILDETADAPAPQVESVEPAVAPPPGHRGRSESPSRSVADDLEAASDAPTDAAAGEGTAGADDLDSLIEQLENAPRIRPDPEFKGEDEELDDDAGELVSETLARIYETQRQYAEAARAYASLAEQQPGRADEFRAKADDMRRRAAESGG